MTVFLFKSIPAANDGKVDFDLSDVMAFAGMLGVSESVRIVIDLLIVLTNITK